MSSKLIDIVIPAYNAGYTIDKTLMSIAIQNIVDKVTVIIVDDYSDNEHIDLYNKYIDMFSPYFEIKYKRITMNMGPGYARKVGLEMGDNQFVTFIDADDVFATSTSLFTLYKDIYNNPNINYTNSVFQEEVKDSEGNFVGYFDHKNDMTWMFGKIYRRSFLEKYKITFNNSRSNEDSGFNTVCMLCNEKPENSYYIDRLTYCWNYNPASITKNNDYSFYGLKGYIYNNIWAIHEIEKRITKDSYIYIPELDTKQTKDKLIVHSINVICLSYLYYQNLLKNGRNEEQIKLYLSWTLAFYRDVYIRYRSDISQATFTSCYKTIMSTHNNLIADWVETISVLQFIDILNNNMLNIYNLVPTKTTIREQVKDETTGDITFKDKEQYIYFIKRDNNNYEGQKAITAKDLNCFITGKDENYIDFFNFDF